MSDDLTAKPTKLTDEQRHQRFVETAREVGAADDEEAFDRAFEAVTSKPDSSPRS